MNCSLRFLLNSRRLRTSCRSSVVTPRRVTLSGNLPHIISYLGSVYISSTPSRWTQSTVVCSFWLPCHISLRWSSLYYNDKGQSFYRYGRRSGWNHTVSLHFTDNKKYFCECRRLSFVTKYFSWLAKDSTFVRLFIYFWVIPLLDSDWFP